MASLSQERNLAASLMGQCGALIYGSDEVYYGRGNPYQDAVNLLQDEVE